MFASQVISLPICQSLDAGRRQLDNCVLYFHGSCPEIPSQVRAALTSAGVRIISHFSTPYPRHAAVFLVVSAEYQFTSADLTCARTCLPGLTGVFRTNQLDEWGKWVVSATAGEDAMDVEPEGPAQSSGSKSPVGSMDIDSESDDEDDGMLIDADRLYSRAPSPDIGNDTELDVDMFPGTHQSASQEEDAYSDDIEMSEEESDEMDFEDDNHLIYPSSTPYIPPPFLPSILPWPTLVPAPGQSGMVSGPSSSVSTLPTALHAPVVKLDTDHIMEDHTSPVSHLPPAPAVPTHPPVAGAPLAPPAPAPAPASSPSPAASSSSVLSTVVNPQPAPFAQPITSSVVAAAALAAPQLGHQALVKRLLEGRPDRQVGRARYALGLGQPSARLPSPLVRSITPPPSPPSTSSPAPTVTAAPTSSVAPSADTASLSTVPRRVSAEKKNIPTQAELAAAMTPSGPSPPDSTLLMTPRYQAVVLPDEQTDTPGQPDKRWKGKGVAAGFGHRSHELPVSDQAGSVGRGRDEEEEYAEDDIRREFEKAPNAKRVRR